MPTSIGASDQVLESIFNVPIKIFVLRNRFDKKKGREIAIINIEIDLPNKLTKNQQFEMYLNLKISLDR